MPPPDEIVASPLTLFLAPIGTAFPAIADEPADFDAAWLILGTEGDLNYDDSGVSVSHSETVSDFTPAGSTMPVKRFRTAEQVEFSLNLVDISPAAYALVMNDAPVTSSGTDDSFSLFRGDQVNSFAVLARGMSAINNELAMQYEISKAFVSVNGNVVYKKGDPAMLPVTVLAVRHSADDVIIYRVANTDGS